MSRHRTYRLLPLPPDLQEHSEKRRNVPPPPKKKRVRYKNCRVATITLPAGPPVEPAPEPVQLEVDAPVVPEPAPEAIPLELGAPVFQEPAHPNPAALLQEPALDHVQEVIPAQPSTAPDMPYGASYDAPRESLSWEQMYRAAMGIPLEEDPMDPFRDPFKDPFKDPFNDPFDTF